MDVIRVREKNEREKRIKLKVEDAWILGTPEMLQFRGVVRVNTRTR